MPLEGKGDTDKVGPVGKGEGVGESAGCKFCYVTALWNKVFAILLFVSIAKKSTSQLPNMSTLTALRCRFLSAASLAARTPACLESGPHVQGFHADKKERRTGRLNEPKSCTGA
jgi:hypothetical protein